MKYYLSNKGEIIAKRLIRNIQKLTDGENKDTSLWNKVYRGKQLSSLEHIFNIQLKMIWRTFVWSYS